MVRVLLLVLAATLSLFSAADAYLSPELQGLRETLKESAMDLKGIMADAGSAIAVAAEVDSIAREIRDMAGMAKSADVEVGMSQVMDMVNKLQKADKDVHQLGVEMRADLGTFMYEPLQGEAKSGLDSLKEKLTQSIKTLVQAE